jgi:hypothetical protein
MVSMVMYVWDSLAFLIVLKLNDLEGDLNFHPCLEFYQTLQPSTLSTTC